MNRHVTDLLSLIKANRIIIYVLLGLALMLQICSKAGQTSVRSDQPQFEEIQQPINEAVEAPKDDTQIDQNHKPNNEMNRLFIMVGLILAFFVAKRYGWLDKLYPKVVIFKVNHYKSKANGNLILKVFLINRTNKSISFNNPTLCFFKGSKKREFIIKNIGGENHFPITLTPGTGHKFSIDAQKFYDKVQGLSDYKTLRMEINTTTDTAYKSMKWPVWLTFRKI